MRIIKEIKTEIKPHLCTVHVEPALIIIIYYHNHTILFSSSLVMFATECCYSLTRLLYLIRRYYQHYPEIVWKCKTLNEEKGISPHAYMYIHATVSVLCSHLQVYRQNTDCSNTSCLVKSRNNYLPKKKEFCGIH